MPPPPPISKLHRSPCAEVTVSSVSFHQFIYATKLCKCFLVLVDHIYNLVNFQPLAKEMKIKSGSTYTGIYKLNILV